MILLVSGCKVLEKEKPKTKKNKLVKLTYIVPEDFKKSNLSTDSSSFYNYTDKYSHDVCDLSVYSMTPFTRDMDVIMKSYMFSEEDRIIKDKKINNQVWKYSTDERKTKGIFYTYITIYQDVLYVIQYDDMGMDSYCKDSFKQILKSVKFEE